jgi:hypothetical protein
MLTAPVDVSNWNIHKTVAELVFIRLFILNSELCTLSSGAAEVS